MSKPKEKKTPKAKAGGSLNGVHGMMDILPKDEVWWKALWHAGLTVSDLHDFHFIETPVAEAAELFERSLGKDADTIHQHVYIGSTKAGRFALRADGMIPVMRSYLQHHLGYFASPLKVFYHGPIVRHTKNDRDHQAHEWGFSVVGETDPLYDAEIALTAIDFLAALRLKNVVLRINSAGCRVCRGNYREKLRAYCTPKSEKLCATCKDALAANPVAILACKEESCRDVRKDAPIVLDYLCQNCNNHLKTVLEIVEDNEILYEPDPYLFREVDYCNRTVFEVRTPTLDAPLVLGGRCDYLSESLGGRMVPATSASIQLENVVQALQGTGMESQFRARPKVFFAAVGDQARKASVKIMTGLRGEGIAVAEAVGKKSLKAQMKAADKAQATLAILFGQKEVFEGSAIVRNMKTSAQETIMLERLAEEVRHRLRSA